MTVQHDRFTITRVYAHPPARVFAAFATEEAKSRWFSGSNESWDQVERAFDFRPGGREHLTGRWKNGTVTTFDCVYFDIVPDSRIVYAYDMHLNDRHISVSLASIEFIPEGKGTKLVLTEHGMYLDGFEDGGGRERGTNEIIDRMGATLTA